jgi:type I site-specific restriction endonuclease
MDKKSLSERDICTKFITPAIQQAGWDIHKQVREEVSFTNGNCSASSAPIISHVQRSKPDGMGSAG